MNNRMIVYMIGRMLGVEGLLLLVPAFVSFLYGEQSGIAFLLTAAILLIIFLLAGRKKPKDVYKRQEKKIGTVRELFVNGSTGDVDRSVLHGQCKCFSAFIKSQDLIVRIILADCLGDRTAD